MNGPHLPSLFVGAVAAIVGAGIAITLDNGDDNDVSVECAAAHVAARWAQDEYGSSTHGIPTRQTDEYRDAAFQAAFEHVEDACGSLNEPRDLWLAYEDLVTAHQYASIDHENPEWRPWYREAICPTLDNPEEIGLCQEDAS